MRPRRNDSKCDWQATPSDYARILKVQASRRKINRRYSRAAEDLTDWISGIAISLMIVAGVVILFWPT